MTEARKHIRVVDTTLRDGSHSISHQYTEGQIRDIVQGLDEARVEILEISHGDGLGGSSINYGFDRTPDEKKLEIAASIVKHSKVAILLLPGVGTKKDLQLAHDHGAVVARIATHVTEANISEQHIGLAKDMGMEVLCFLMMAHMADIPKMVEQARLMQGYGAARQGWLRYRYRSVPTHGPRRAGCPSHHEAPAGYRQCCSDNGIRATSASAPRIAIRAFRTSGMALMIGLA